jgi:hypothetical protein
MELAMLTSSEREEHLSRDHLRETRLLIERLVVIMLFGGFRRRANLAAVRYRNPVWDDSRYRHLALTPVVGSPWCLPGRCIIPIGTRSADMARGARDQYRSWIR